MHEIIGGSFNGSLVSVQFAVRKETLREVLCANRVSLRNCEDRPDIVFGFFAPDLFERFKKEDGEGLFRRTGDGHHGRKSLESRIWGLEERPYLRFVASEKEVVHEFEA